MTQELEPARAAVSGAVELEAALAEQEAYAAHTRELAKRYPEVLEAHAQFGGEIPEMLRLYAYEGTRQELATLRSDNERLGRERDEARAEVDWWKKSSEWEGDMHDFHKSRSLRLELGLLRTCPQLGISEAWTDDDKLAAIEAHFGISFAPNRLQERTEPRPETARAQAAEAERDTLLAQVARVERVLCDLDPENAIDDSLLRDVHARLQVHGEKYPDRAVSVLHRNVVFYTIQAAVRAALTKEPS